MKNVIFINRSLLVRRGHWLERLLMRLPRWLINMESARIGNDTGWTKVRRP